MIRSARPDDLAALVALEQASGGSWTLKGFQAELKHSFAHVWLYEPESAIKLSYPLLGFCVFWQLTDSIDLLNVVVQRLFRRQGIGQLLLKTVIDHGCRRYLRNICLEVRRNNGKAVRLYLANGFRVMGLRPQYYRPRPYQQSSEDALLMEKQLGNKGSANSAST